LDAVEELRELYHHLSGLVAVGQYIQQVGRAHEIEARESTTLSIHEIVQRFLAHRQLGLHLLELGVHAGLIAEIDAVLHECAPGKDILHILVDTDETLGLLWQLLFHFLRTNKEILQECP
jgi:hypothetical protein